MRHVFDGAAERHFVTQFAVKVVAAHGKGRR